MTLTPIDPIALQVGPLAVRWYSVTIVVAIASAIWLAGREARRRGLDPEFISEAAIWAVPAGILGARAYEVLVLQWPYYRLHPLEIPAIWQGGLAIHGGLIGGLLAGYLFVRRRRADFWQWADVVAPGIILAQAIGRWGNFFNQEAYGAQAPDWIMRLLPSVIREGMFIDGAYRHPTFLYESLWNLAAFGLLYAFQRRSHHRGAVFFAYLVLYNLGRFFIESIRMDSSFIFGSLRVAQLVALALMMAGAAGLRWSWHRNREKTR